MDIWTEVQKFSAPDYQLWFFNGDTVVRKETHEGDEAFHVFLDCERMIAMCHPQKVFIGNEDIHISNEFYWYDNVKLYLLTGQMPLDLVREYPKEDK